MNGVRNLLSIFFILYIFNFMVKQYDKENIKYIRYILPNPRDILLSLFTLFIIFIRYIVLFYVRKNILLYIFELFLAFYVFQIENFLLSLILAMVLIISLLKSYSFLESNKKYKNIQEEYKKEIKEFNLKHKDKKSTNTSSGLLGIKRRDNKSNSNTSLYSESDIKGIEENYTEYTYEEVISIKYYMRSLFTPTLLYLDAGWCSFSFRKLMLYFFGSIPVVISMLFFNIFYFIPSVVRIENLYNCFSSLENILVLFTLAVIEWVFVFLSFFFFYLHIMGALSCYHYEAGCWWNIESVKLYWKYWNIPMHRWFKEYIFKRLKYKVNNIVLLYIIFLASGILHEYLFFLVFKKVRFLGLLSMMSHPFIMKIGDLFLWCKMGNWFFWVSFGLFGFPISILITYSVLK